MDQWEAIKQAGLSAFDVTNVDSDLKLVDEVAITLPRMHWLMISAWMGAQEAKPNAIGEFQMMIHHAVVCDNKPHEMDPEAQAALDAFTKRMRGSDIDDEGGGYL